MWAIGLGLTVKIGFPVIEGRTNNYGAVEMGDSQVVEIRRCTAEGKQILGRINLKHERKHLVNTNVENLRWMEPLPSESL